MPAAAVVEARAWDAGRAAATRAVTERTDSVKARLRDAMWRFPRKIGCLG
jgi:hypothetical protein